MTDEERQTLCSRLRREYYDGEYAATEIERLVAEKKELQERLDWLDGVALGKPG